MTNASSTFSAAPCVPANVVAEPSADWIRHAWTEKRSLIRSLSLHFPMWPPKISKCHHETYAQLIQDVIACNMQDL